MFPACIAIRVRAPGRAPVIGLRGWRPMVAVLTGAAVAWGGLSYVALTIGVFAEGYHYTLSQAALLATLELGAMAAAAMSGGRMLNLLTVRQLAMAGGLVAGLANIATACVTDPVIVGGLRVLTGVGFGWMTAGLNTSISRSQDAQRLFIRANLGSIGGAVVFFAVMPLIYGRTGFPVYFIAYGILCLLTAATMTWLTDHPVAAGGVRAAPRAGTAARMSVLISISVIWLCYAAVWSLIERFGRDIGMTEEAIGYVLSFGTFCGLAGVAVSILLAGRFKPLGPLIFTSLTTGLCYVWLVYVHDATAYTWNLSIWGVVFCPILAYALAVATEVDPSGALSRLVGGGTAITTALGPLVGDYLTETFGFPAVGFGTFAASAVCCAVLAVVVPRSAHLRIAAPAAQEP
jgi:MFS family permease